MTAPMLQQQLHAEHVARRQQWFPTRPAPAAAVRPCAPPPVAVVKPPPAPPRARVWTAERNAELGRLAAEGMAPTQIAAVLSRDGVVVTRDQVAGRLRATGTKTLGRRERSPDLAGAVFGRLTVMSRSDRPGGKAHWVCLCECGGRTEARADNLRRSQTRSCGKCLRVEPPPSEVTIVSIGQIQKVVAAKYSLTQADLVSSRRTHDVTAPRHVAMYLAKILTRQSLPQIGHRFGDRDHTTVLYAVRKISGEMSADAGFAIEIDGLIAELRP